MTHAASGHPEFAGVASVFRPNYGGYRYLEHRLPCSPGWESVEPEVSKHSAQVSWHGSGEEFREGRYSRAHIWRFDGGAVVAASASPAVVKHPHSDPTAVDPEEAFVASIASCHMLSFLYEASRRGFVVLSYVDDAVGQLTKNEQRVPWVSEVVLSPRIVFQEGAEPTPAELSELHDVAHHACFIANSVKTNIMVR